MKVLEDMFIKKGKFLKVLLCDTFVVISYASNGNDGLGVVAIFQN